MSKTYLNKGILVSSNSLKPQYEFTGPKDFFSMPANIIPGISGVSGGRILLGSKASLQAISLTNRQAPLVQSISRKDNTSFVKTVGHELLTIISDVAGQVTGIDDKHITVKDNSGNDHKFDIYHYYNLGRKSFLTHIPKVRVGDKVKKGEILATSNYTDSDGVLAMGTNLTTAVMPYRSGNFEDAFVVTESGAKKLEAEQMLKYRIEKRQGIEVDKPKYISLFPNKYYNNQLSKIDADGVVKVGEVLHYGDPVILALSPKALKSVDIQLGKLSKGLKNAFNDNSQTWDLNHPGEVVDVSKHGPLITVNIKTVRGLAVGDKLCMTDDHEVLTLTGWKAITQIAVGELICSLNPDNQEIEYIPAKFRPEYDYTGMMYNLETTQVSMCVTPNHKLYTQKRHGGRNNHAYHNTYKLEKAETLFGSRFKLKNNGIWKGKEQEFITVGDTIFKTDDYLTLLGLFLGDGNTFWHKKSGSYGIDISQKKEPETTQIKEVLDKIGIKYCKSETAFRIYSKNLALHFKQFGLAKDKFIPDYLFNLSYRQLGILYKYLMLTDGSEKGTGHCYTTISRQLADDVQRLCLHVGYAGKIEFYPGGHKVTFPNGITSIASDCYKVYMYRHKNEPEINHGHTKKQSGQVEQWVGFSGKVYCVTLDKNHIFYVRRDGKPHWTGNSNSFGAKGVCGAIISDSSAPTTADGKPVDLILNSMSVASRVAPALAVNIGLGKLANKLGHPVTMTQFSENPSVASTIKVLKKHGISETELLHDPVTGRNFTALVGPLYTSRLTHIAEDKESYRGQGVAYNWDMQPTKTDEESSKRVGNLSTAALLSHGAKKVLEDIGTIKATKNDLWWSRLKLGLPAPSPTVPFIFNKFIASLQGAGVNVTKSGHTYKILPETNSDIAKLSAGPIENPLTFKIKNNNLIPEKGGLFDPTLTGVMGDRFNHIDLHVPIPNPISEDYFRKLLEVTKDKYLELITSGKIQEKLEAIDIDKKITEYRQYIKTGKRSNRDDAVKLLAFLMMLKNNNIKIKDLILNKIPVLPAAYRPIAIQGDSTLPSPVNLLYKDLMLTNSSLKDHVHIPETLKTKLKADLYQSVKAVYGLSDAITAKHKDKGIKGLLSTTLGTHGGSAKVTMFQAKVVNKPVDLVSRSVLTPDTKLDLDEASVPQEILWKTYSPFVIRRLVQRGVPATQALSYVQSRNPMAIQALLEELKIRPGIISRDPSLHKYNLTGFFLKPNADYKDKTLKLNPLVFKSFSADNDGDQLNINIPASEEARLEIIEKMLPSKNLLSPKNFAPVYVPSNEAALGLFESSIRDNKNTPKKFASREEVKRAFDKGELDIGDRVEIG